MTIEEKRFLEKFKSIQADYDLLGGSGRTPFHKRVSKGIQLLIEERDRLRNLIAHPDGQDLQAMRQRLHDLDVLIAMRQVLENPQITRVK